MTQTPDDQVRAAVQAAILDLIMKLGAKPDDAELLRMIEETSTRAVRELINRHAARLTAAIEHQRAAPSLNHPEP